jgi:uncharacterized damage-inducible protein DinB
MLKTQIQTLFAYHWHTTAHLIACAARLDAADYTDDAGQGSIHSILFHLLRTDQSWRKGLESGRQLAGANPEDYPDLAAIQRGFEEEQQAWGAHIAGLSEAEIAGDRQLTDWRGESSSIAYWRVFQHLILHGMQHHAEIAQLLTEKGHSPGNIDFLFFRG